MKFARVLMLFCVCVLPLAASAQWQWLDRDGKKVFSDQPPPTDVPEKSILRRPGSPSARPAPVAPVAADSSSASAEPARNAASGASAAKPAGVDKDLEDKARKAEEAEKAKQAAEAQKLAKAKADNCNRARQGKATFDSGIRVARLNAQGEREVLDDKARATEQQRLQGIIDSDCR